MSDKQTDEASNNNLNESFSHSLEMLNAVMSKSLGIAMHNAVNAQHHAQIVNAAAATSICARILSIANINLTVPPPPLSNKDSGAKKPAARAAKKK